jgi:hypothetical protein
MKKVITQKSSLMERRLDVPIYKLAKKYNPSRLVCLLDPDSDRSYSLGEGHAAVY